MGRAGLSVGVRWSRSACWCGSEYIEYIRTRLRVAAASRCIVRFATWGSRALPYLEARARRPATTNQR